MSDTDTLPEKKDWQPPTIQDFDIEEQTQLGGLEPSALDGTFSYS